MGWEKAIRGSLFGIMRKSEEAENNDKIIRIYHECEGGMGKSHMRITVWHHEEIQKRPRIMTR